MNKKAQYQTNTVLLFLIVIYFIVVTLTYGLIGQEIGKYRPDLVNKFTCKTYGGNDCNFQGQTYEQQSFEENSGILGTNIHTPKLSFFQGIGVTFSSAPWWLHMLIFTPFIVLLGWLVFIIVLHGG